MPSFEYVAIDSQGQSVKGVESAKNVPQLVERLRRRTLTVVDIREDLGWGKRFVELLGFGERLPLQAMVVFMRQFATMVSAGIPLTTILASLSSQSLDRRVDMACFEVARQVQEGHSLSSAFEMQGRSFPPLTVPLLKAGEVSGKLDEMLDRLATHLESELALTRAWRQATFYPVILFLICTSVTIALVAYVFPVFIDLFVGLSIELPTLTKALITVTETVRNPVVIGPFVLGLIVGLFVLRSYLRTPIGRRQWDWLKLEMPYFGALYRGLTFSRLARTLATLMESGLPLILSLRIAGAAAANSVVRDVLQQVASQIEKGGELAELLWHTEFFPQVFCQFVEAGEEVGQVPNMLERLADLLEEEVRYSLEAFTSLIEPIMIACMGVLVLVVLVAVFQPVYQLMELF